MGAASFGATPPNFDLAPGTVMPDLRLQNHDETSVSLGRDIPASAVYLVLSLQCPLCVDLMPWVSDLAQRVPAPHLVILCDGTPEEHQEIVDYYGWSLPVLTLTELAKESLNIAVHPCVLITDSEGRIRDQRLITHPRELLQLQLG
ncbi:MAG: hypothetical protein ACOY94_01390 [Bacillota bacterium]